MERALVGIGWAATELVEALQLGAQHVVEDEQMIVARALRRLGVVADHHRVRADFRLGKHHAESHVVFSSFSGLRLPGLAALPEPGLDSRDLTGEGEWTRRRLSAMA